MSVDSQSVDNHVNYIQVGPDIHQMIRETCSELAEFLIEKNMKYGNSALNPKRILSSADPREQILIRMDDKLSRLLEGRLDDTEDVLKDFVGYWILLKVYDRLQVIVPEFDPTTDITYYSEPDQGTIDNEGSNPSGRTWYTSLSDNEGD